MHLPADMVTMLLHDGASVRYELVETAQGLRLRSRGADFDLLGAMRQLDWRIVAAGPEDRAVLERFGIHGGRVQ